MKFKLAILVLALLPCYSMATTQVSICMENVAFEPLIMGKDTVDLNKPGIAVEIALQAAKKANLALNFIRRPWARCLSLVAKGKIDGLLSSVHTATRAQTYQFPDNKQHYLVPCPYHIFYSTSSKHAGFYEALAKERDKTTLIAPKLNYGLTASFGYVANDLLAKLGLLSNHYYNADAGLKMVANGKLDGYVMMKLIGQGKLRQLALTEQITATQKPLLSEKLYIVFNKEFYKDNPQLAESFWQQLPTARIDKLPKQ